MAIIFVVDSFFELLLCHNLKILHYFSVAPVAKMSKNYVTHKVSITFL